MFKARVHVVGITKKSHYKKESVFCDFLSASREVIYKLIK